MMQFILFYNFIIFYNLKFCNFIYVFIILSHEYMFQIWPNIYYLLNSKDSKSVLIFSLASVVVELFAGL
jgi:hypothetical protein